MATVRDLCDPAYTPPDPPKRVLGADLRVGDTIEVWWSREGHPPNRDTITGLRPYTGALAHLFPKGAQLADFVLCRTGMTIENDNYFNVTTRGRK